MSEKSGSGRLKDIADRFQRNERLTGPGWAAEIHIALAEVDAATKAAKAEGWDEACQALAWCFDNGPERDALPYLIEHNPFRDEVQS